MNNPLVSVVIPFYYNISWLVEAIESVFDQTYNNMEIIVINDGSQENTTSFLESYGSKIIYKYKENGGPATARNCGIELATGKYIAFLDSDDLWDSTKIEKQVKLMEENNSVWSHTNWLQFSNNSVSNVKRIYDTGNEGYIFPSSILSMNIATPSVMVNAKYLKERTYLRFHEKMRFGQDYYLWLLLSIEAPVFLIKEILCFARLRSGENAVSRARVHIQLRAQIWKFVNLFNPEIFKNIKYSRFISFSYRICVIEFEFISWMERKLGIGTKLSEIISKVIYTLPYFSFKLIKNSKITIRE